MATSYDERIFDAARIQSPGCLDGVLRLEYFNAVTDFLRRSNAWHEDIDVPVQPQFTDYILPIAGGAAITRLIWLEGVRPSSGSVGGIAHGSGRRGFLVHPYDQGTLLRIPQVPPSAETWHALSH